MKRAVLATIVVLSVGGFASGVLADPITGVETGNAIAYPGGAPSTNALNYAKQTPGYEGSNTPFVTFVSAAPNSVTLEFKNSWATPNVLAFFEYRIDGLDTGSTNHPVVTGDTIHSGVSVRSPGSTLYPTAATESTTRTFTANTLVEVRLALGGERDWDFDWTGFRPGAAVVPLPAAAWAGMALMGSLAGVKGVKRLRRRDA